MQATLTVCHHSSRSPPRCGAARGRSVLDEAADPDPASSVCWRSRSTCCSAMPACSRSAMRRSSRSRPIRRAILQVRHGVPTIARRAGGLLAGTLLPLLFGLSVRTRGVYFILITIALGYIVWGVAYRWASFTGGDNGVTNVPAPGGRRLRDHNRRPPTITSCWRRGRCACSATAFSSRSPFGLALRGIKSSETRMRSLGYRRRRISMRPSCCRA